MVYEEDGVHGSIPKFGAIFMSNISTKRECFRRKLLGLPSAQANFVKHVKAGMILFLFEFERRELYGVFRACSDGSMNIVPHAYSSSGKQFPAQVRFTPIWYCSPLSEHEFRDAIQENYFSKNKFNFGLSEDQVYRLLLLFNSKKLEKPQSELSRLASKPIGKDRRVTGNDRLFLRNWAENFVEEDNLVPAINSKDPGNSSNNIGRLDDGKLLMNERMETPAYHFMNHLDFVRRSNDHNRFLPSIDMGHGHNLDNGLGYRYPLDKVRHLDDKGTFLKIDRVNNEYNMERCFEPPMSNNLGQSTQDPSFSSSKSVMETDYSLSRDQPKPRSAFPHSMEQKNLEFSYPTSHDAMATRCVPYDPDVPDIHLRSPTFVGVNCSSHLVQDFPPRHISLENLFPFSKKASSPYCLEEETLSRHCDVASGFMNKAPLLNKPNDDSFPCCRTNSSFLGDEYYGKREAQSTDHEVCQDSPFAESASASIPYSRNEIYEMGHLDSGSSPEKSNNHDVKYSQNLKGIHADSKNERISVFARLSLASEVYRQENDMYLQYDECDMDASVDQVMDMLHQSLNHTIMKVRKLPLFQQLNMESKKLKMTIMKMQNAINQVTEEKSDEISEETRVVSFKRRSETMKNNDGIKTMYSVDSVERGMKSYVQKPEGEGIKGEQRKRRKLVRPVFGKKVELNESWNGDGSLNLQSSALESCSKDNTGSCDHSIKSRENEKCSSPKARLVQLASSTGCEGDNDIINQSSDCEEKISENYCSNRPVGREESFDEAISIVRASTLQLSSHEISNAK